LNEDAGQGEAIQLNEDVGQREATGFLHSYETLGALDGPGLRLVVFMQGCPLRCRYCHNPDTWHLGGPAGLTAAIGDVVGRARRMKPYFGKFGGVTLSGGEPLSQPEFLLALLTALHRDGISTALDTSGWALLETARLEAILTMTDLVLLDIKHPDPDGFRWLTGQPIGPLLAFLAQCARMGKDLWVRQVIVPGWNDSSDQLAGTVKLIQEYPGLRVRRWQLLPYHALGRAKYGQMGLPEPFPGVPAMPSGELADLQAALDLLVREAGLIYNSLDGSSCSPKYDFNP
jgi:pyruvate formate lyase activating enzyme